MADRKGPAGTVLGKSEEEEERCVCVCVCVCVYCSLCGKRATIPAQRAEPLPPCRPSLALCPHLHPPSSHLGVEKQLP